MIESIKLWEEYRDALNLFDNKISRIFYKPKPINLKEIVKSNRIGMFSINHVSGVDHGSIDTDLFLLPNNTNYLNKTNLFQLAPPPSFPSPPQRPNIPENLKYLFESLNHNTNEKNIISFLKKSFDNLRFESDSIKKQIQYFKLLVQETIWNEDKIINELKEKKNTYLRIYENRKKKFENILNQKKDEKIISTFNLFNEIFKLPAFLDSNLEVFVVMESKAILIEFEFPSFDNKEIVIGQTARYQNKYASAKQKSLIIEKCLYSLIIRVMYLSALSVDDNDDDIEGIAVNVKHSWHDSATGKLEHGIAASIFANISEVKEFDLSKLDPVACFKSLKGLNTISHKTITSLRPIFQYNKEDNRIVKTEDVESKIEINQNLASMEWEDFEHLVAQLFEWEFKKNGIEVKVTRASRDRGVDAILFDPDPLKGGKYVIQAKRYTRTVDVSAVRDLYGTVMNEGANRGILITTASYGPDAYDFAKDKPISLVDGPNLLVMLKKHGKKFRIDLDEARRLNNESQ